MNAAKIGLELTILGLLFLLTSCAGEPTMEELEMEASRTGDWSEVERREAREKARLEASGPACPEHLIKVCVREGPRMVCSCTTPAGFGQP